VAPILRLTPEGDGPKAAPQLAPAMWGLVPSWWNKPLSEKRFATHNARAETVCGSNTFRGAFRRKRCLVPASGFYVWTGEGRTKQAYAVGLRKRAWFCFAGLWDRVMIDGSELDTFTILTQVPNDVLAVLDARSPVIPDPADYGAWLDPSTPVRTLCRIMEPPPADAMHAWPVGPAVGNVRNQGPELIAEV
ncbi:MAG: SOS response-associated peptidase, partial [Pseudomonadota bacterium]